MAPVKTADGRPAAYVQFEPPFGVLVVILGGCSMRRIDDEPFVKWQIFLPGPG